MFGDLLGNGFIRTGEKIAISEDLGGISCTNSNVFNIQQFGFLINREKVKKGNVRGGEEGSGRREGSGVGGIGN